MSSSDDLEALRRQLEAERGALGGGNLRPSPTALSPTTRRESGTSPPHGATYVRDSGAVLGLSIWIGFSFLALVVVLAQAGVLSNQAFFGVNPLFVVPLAWPLAELLHWLGQKVRTFSRRTRILHRVAMPALLFAACVFLSMMPVVYFASLRPGVLGGGGVVPSVLLAAAWASLWATGPTIVVLLVAELVLTRFSGPRAPVDVSLGWVLAPPVACGVVFALFVNPEGPEVLPLESWPIVGGIMALGVTLCMAAQFLRGRGLTLAIPAAVVIAIGAGALSGGVAVASSWLDRSRQEWATDSERLASVAPSRCTPVRFARGSAFRAVARAEVRCRIEAANVRIWWLGSPAALDSFRASRDIQLSDNGACRDGRTDTGEWAFSRASDDRQGAYSCFFRAGRPHLDYDFDAEPVYVSIARSDVSLSRLWKTFTRLKVGVDKL